jgi:hypothetical protein
MIPLNKELLADEALVVVALGFGVAFGVGFAVGLGVGAGVAAGLLEPLP